MNLWIRSQDKRRLLKIDNFLQEIKDVITFTKGEGLIVLGTYQSEKRALEVLNETQDYLIRQGQIFITTNENGIPNGSKYYSNVYEMPKE